MSVRAIRVTHGDDSDPVRVMIDADDPEDLRTFLAPERPTAYIVRNRDMRRFSALEREFVDRGIKHEAKPLSKLLLGHDRVPLIRGTYTSAGRLLHGVGALLRNAQRKGERRAYLVGTDAPVFQELLERAGGEWKPAREPALMRSAGSAGRPASQEGDPTEEVLELLPKTEVPAELAERFVGDDAAVHLVHRLILRAAESNEPVLIVGETGTGKEVVARCIHDFGSRRLMPFIAVNCGSIPADLFESELFGHEKGAFTGAVFKKSGLWKVAGSGTLFLDEIGDLAPHHQAKILRALQEERILPVGSVEEVKVRARVIAATNRDLYGMVRTGEFREDLFYRLRALFIETPRLQDHPDDIPALARFFWRRIAKDSSVELPKPILLELQAYGWPGNARELRAVLASMHELFGADVGLAHLNAVFHLHGHRVTPASADAAGAQLDLRSIEASTHLQRVEEVIGACRLLVEASRGQSAERKDAIPTVRTAFARRLGELQLLCDPRFFPDERTFTVIHSLHGKLAYYVSVLETNPSGAHRYGRKELINELNIAQTMLEDAIEDLRQDL